ncbi:MAG: hypothetical protein AB1861_31000 [Cyanobacteriota bacterium]
MSSGGHDKQCAEYTTQAIALQKLPKRHYWNSIINFFRGEEGNFFDIIPCRLGQGEVRVALAVVNELC